MEKFSEGSGRYPDISEEIELSLETIARKYKFHWVAPLHDIARIMIANIAEFEPINEDNLKDLVIAAAADDFIRKLVHKLTTSKWRDDSLKKGSGRFDAEDGS